MPVLQRTDCKLVDFSHSDVVLCACQWGMVIHVTPGIAVAYKGFDVTKLKNTELD